jgi:imidazolonepropionase-like amidohydrolase
MASNNLVAEDSFVLIRGGTILTITKGILSDNNILIKNGKIVDIAEEIETPDGALVIDAKDKIVMPGMIDLLAHIATMGSSWKWDEGNERSSLLTAQLDIVDSIDPYHEDFNRALSGGVTTVLISPGSRNIIGGKQALLKCCGPDLESKIIKREAGMKFGIYRKKNESRGVYPSTMMGLTTFLQDVLNGAREYAKGLKTWEQTGKKTPKPKNQMMDSLVKLLNGEIAARMHAESAQEIMIAISIADEFNLKLDLIHALDAYKVIDEISSRDINVIYGPIHPAYSDDTFQSPALLDEAGVKLCLTTDSPVFPQKHLRYQAILAVKCGMKRESALKAITINPAEIVGMSDRLGSIEIGKDGDIVIFDGHPLDIMSKVELVLVDGKICYREKSVKGGTI